MDEPPAQHIIEDDESLDSFLMARRSKVEAEQRKSRLQSAGQTGGKGKREKHKIL